MTLDKIKKHMLDYMSHNPIDNGEYYDEDGHCGDGLWLQIKDFWKNFNSDKDLTFVVSGKYMSDDLDLDGGRSYILSRSGVIPLLFDYLYNNLGYTKKKYKNIIFNSLSITDELEDMFDDISVVRDSKIESVLQNEEVKDKNQQLTETLCIAEHNIWSSLNFDKKEEVLFIPSIVKYSKDRKQSIDKFESLEYIGDSKIDKDPIYKIKSLGVEIPGGYEIVYSVDKYLN